MLSSTAPDGRFVKLRVIPLATAAFAGLLWSASLPLVAQETPATPANPPAPAQATPTTPTQATPIQATPAQATPTAPASATESVGDKFDTFATPSSETPITIGSSFQLASKVYQKDREVNVWTPPSYAKGEKTYPVLYLIDGGLEQDFHHISGLAQLSTLNANYDELIVVGIKTDDRFMELTSEPKDPRYIRTPPTAGKSDDFYRYVAEEVMPFVKSRYRVSERSVLIGESLAGLFVAEVFLKHPDTCTDYISVSPSLWWDDKALGKSAAELLAAHDDSKRQLYLTMANEGGTMQGGLDLIVSAIKAKPPAGLTWHYIDRRESETHSSIFHGAALDALKKLFGKPQPEMTEVPWYLVEGGQPPKPEPAKEEEPKKDDQ